MSRSESMLMEFDSKNGLKVISFASDRSGIGNTATVAMAGDVKKDIRYWGPKNDLPNYRDDLLCDNNIIGELIDTKRKILLGNGLQPYIEKFADGKKTRELVEIPKEIMAWMDDSMFYENYLEGAPLQFFKHGNIFAEFVLNKGGKVFSVHNKDCRYMRLCAKENGKIPGVVYAPNWVRSKHMEKEKMIQKREYIPMLNMVKPQPKFVVHIYDDVFTDGYYGLPAYWGGEEWIKVSNAIPVFHESNLKNGYTIRFLVTYPEGYFLDKYEYEATDSISELDKQNSKKAELIDKATQAKQAFIDNVNKLLAGVENAGRALFAEAAYNKISEEYEGIKIEPINFDLKDKSLLELFEKTNDANIMGQGMPRTLAGIEGAKGLGSSGNEWRNSFNGFVLSKMPHPRRKVLKVWDIVCKINGWKEKYPDMKWTFEDFEIAKLDDDKSGVKPMNPNDNGDKGVQ